MSNEFYKSETWTIESNGQIVIGDNYMKCILEKHKGEAVSPKKIIIGEGFEYIYSGAFCSIDTLVSVEFPSTIKLISSYAFNSNLRLQELDFRKVTIVKISQGAFLNCPKIQDIHFSYYMSDEEENIRRLIFNDNRGICLTPALIKGRNFVITGTFSVIRAEIEDKINKYGGYVSSSVSKSTDFVLVGTKPGATKLNAAKKYLKATIDNDAVTKFIYTY